MYARSTTVMGDPGNIDAGIAYVRDEVMPALTGMDGCVGMSMLVNRTSGRCIVTSSWATEDAMQATTQMVSSLRTRAAEILGGPQYVDVWEVAIMHREHDTHDDHASGWCRVTWLDTEPSRMEESIGFYRDTVLPRVQQMHGFCSSSMLVDREGSRMCGTVRFETAEDLAASREMAAALRAQRTEMGGATFTDIEEMELALAHLRAPELV